MLNETHIWPQSGHFFSRVRAFFQFPRKGRGYLSPLTSSSYASDVALLLLGIVNLYISLTHLMTSVKTTLTVFKLLFCKFFARNINQRCFRFCFWACKILSVFSSILFFFTNFNHMFLRKLEKNEKSKFI